MRPRPIGIIGGAGPLAGAFLLERVLTLATQQYECYKDSDFPQIILISFPFSEMLGPVIQPEKVKLELNECLNQLRQNGASVLAVACNTLHAFLDEKEDWPGLIHLPRALAAEMPLLEKPLVFCTSTSARFGLHKRFFPCQYPDKKTQGYVDVLIDGILKGENKQAVLKKLEGLLREQHADTIVLGCTELSLFAAHLSVPNKRILDPLEIVANKILEQSFFNNKE